MKYHFNDNSSNLLKFLFHFLQEYAEPLISKLQSFSMNKSN